MKTLAAPLLERLLPTKMGKPLRILLAIDHTPASEAAVCQAAGVRWPEGSEIQVVCVIPDMKTAPGVGLETIWMDDSPLTPRQEAALLRAEGIVLQAACRLSHGRQVAQGRVLVGRSSQAILDFAKTWQADLILLSHRIYNTPETGAISATAHKVAHYAHCSVWLARASRWSHPVEIVHGVDGSNSGQRATAFLSALNLPGDAAVTIVSVAEFIPLADSIANSPMKSDMGSHRSFLLDYAGRCNDQAVGMLRSLRGPLHHIIRFGSPEVELIRAASRNDADLIVIGAEGNSCSGPAPIGKVAQKVAKYAPCSVLLVR